MKNIENMETEYFLITKTEDIEGTCYFEFLPGKYKEKSWNKESVFLNEDSVALFEDFLHQVSLQMASRFPPVTENSFPSVNKKIIPPFFDFAPYKNHR